MYSRHVNISSHCLQYKHCTQAYYTLSAILSTFIGADMRERHMLCNRPGYKTLIFGHFLFVVNPTMYQS